MNETDNTIQILESSRFWILRVLVPMVVCIGVIGNTVTVMVLTRRRMRSSTNIYLSALAIADIIHNLFVLLLSFEHYPNIHEKKYELYWRFFGLMHWLCDAASSTSVWLTVSFTVERYIAVCHPIKGKVFCTENRAKSIITIVYIFCLLTTASTTFEYQLSFTDTCIKECPLERIKKTHHTAGNLVNHNGTTTIHIQHHSLENLHHDYPNLKILNDMVVKSILANCSEHHSHIILGPIYVNSPSNTTNITTISDNIVENQVPPPPLQNVTDDDNGTIASLLGILKNGTFNETECCHKKYTIDTESTSLGNNNTYTTFISWYSAIFFALVPLILICTFNCFLIRAVYYSQKMRKDMVKNSQENLSMSNENKITLMLIAVILVFIICQTPTAFHLMYYNIREQFATEPLTPRARRIVLITGNIFNLLVVINASSNFVLYCVLSKKFRSTFKKLFCERRKKQQDTIVLTNRSSQKFDSKSHGIRRNASEYHTPRNLETQSLTGIPRSKSLMTRPAGRAKSTDLIV